MKREIIYERRIYKILISVDVLTLPFSFISTLNPKFCLLLLLFSEKWIWTNVFYTMGCSASFHHRGSSSSLPAVGLKPVSVSLSPETKNTLKESWKLVEPVKIDAGKAMFVR